MSNKFQITEGSVTVIIDGRSVSVAKGQPNYTPLVEALLRSDWDAVKTLVTVKTQLAAWSDGAFRAEGNQIFHGEEPLPSALAQQILQALKEGVSPQRYLLFWVRLAANPSYRSVEQLFGFLQHQGILVTPTGTFLAYKGITSNGKDCHSNHFDNTPGQVLQMERRRVSDDPQTPCHFGFHVGAWEYAASFGAQVVLCEVDPADVVCVPYDHSAQKMRVCKYKVVGFRNAPLKGGLIEDHDIPQVTTPAAVAVEDETFKHTNGAAVVPGETVAAKQQPILIPILTGDYAHLNLMDGAALFDLPLDALRRYASQNLLIAGASKLPGGKSVLMQEILKQRGYVLSKDAPARVRGQK